MDFVPAPEGATHWPVPDLGGVDYDGLGFVDYPSRTGWDLKKLQDIGRIASPCTVDDSFLLTAGKLQVVSTRTTAAQFLQTWLYFGLLSDFLRRKILRSDHTILSDQAGKVISVLTSAKFQEYGKEWFESIPQMDESERSSELARCSSILEAASTFLSDLELFERNNNAPPLLPFNISLCLRCSFVLLSEWIVQFTKLTYLSASIKRKPRRRLPSTYCPNVLTRGSHSELDIYYSDLIGNQRHTDHSRCIESACVASTIDEATYHTKHSHSCKEDACFEVTAPSETSHGKDYLQTVQSILRGGQIPLIRLPECKGTIAGSNMLVEISGHEPAAEHGQPYIAISHVWADGLGNTVANSLPSCQVARLRLFMDRLMAKSDLSGTDFCWMDTFCVPLNPKETRKAAIRLMRETYMAAEATLVLDASLLDVKAPKSPEETLMRILYSNWMTRLWTLQEGVLSPRLFFQFSDRAVELEDVLMDITDMPAYHPAMGMAEIAASALMKLVFPAEALVPHELLTYYWRNLGHRSTSRDQDVPVCVATLIGSPLDKIVGQEDEIGRMEAFWSSQEYVPRGFLFLPGVKLEKYPYRWALQSLLQSAANSWIRAGVGRSLDPATCTPSGLFVEGLPAFLIHDFLILEEITDLYFWISHRRTGHVLSVVNIRTSSDSNVSDISLSEDIQSRYADLAQYSKIFILLEDDLDVMESNVMFSQTGRGCIVASSEAPGDNDDGVTEVKFLSSVIIGIVGDVSDSQTKAWVEDVDTTRKWLIT